MRPPPPHPRSLSLYIIDSFTGLSSVTAPHGSVFTGAGGKIIITLLKAGAEQAQLVST